MAEVEKLALPLAAGWIVRGYERGTGVIGRVTMTKAGHADSIVRIDVSKPMFLDPLPAGLSTRSDALAEQLADSLESTASWSVSPGAALSASEAGVAYLAAASRADPAPARTVPAARPPTAKKPR